MGISIMRSYMIYIFVALYPEAEPIIRRLGLKKDRVEFGFDVYAGEEPEVRLVITGVGMVAAAAAVGSILTYYHAGKKDISGITLINFGSCAGKGRVGEVCLCNKIIDYSSGYTFYPDILYHHDFPESCVVTGFGVLKEELDGFYGESLYDMEASAIFQTASRILGPHQMSFFKVISDSGKGEKLCAEEFSKTMETGAEAFLGYLTEYRNLDISESRQGEDVCVSEVYRIENGRGKADNVLADRKGEICEQEFEELCSQLHCSEAMRIAVRQCIKYWSLSGVDYQAVFRQMREQKELPCRDRREGKKRFEELKKRLL